MGLTWHQAQMLAHLAEQKRLITQVSHQRRVCPLLVTVREECLKRGPITHAVCEFFKYAPRPTFGPRDHMMDDCTHAIDTLRWMGGGEVVAIESRCKRVGTPEYQMTAPVWIRGILADDYGVPIDSVTYVTGGEETPGRDEKLKLNLPPRIKVERIYCEVKDIAIGGCTEEIMKDLAIRQMGL